MFNVISYLKPFDFVDHGLLPLNLSMLEEGRRGINTLGLLITQPCSTLVGHFE